MEQERQPELRVLDQNRPPLPVEVSWWSGTAGAGRDAGLQACLHAAAARLARSGRRLHPGDLELVADPRH